MKILVIPSRNVAEVNDSYGMRLIEQGKAVILPTSAEKTAVAGGKDSTARPKGK